MEPEMCFCATAQPQPLVTGRRLLILGLFEEDGKLLVRQGSAELEEPVPPPGRSGRSRMPGRGSRRGFYPATLACWSEGPSWWNQEALCAV